MKRLLGHRPPFPSAAEPATVEKLAFAVSKSIATQLVIRRS